MHELAPIIRDLAVILGVAGIVTLVFQKIRQPVVLGYLVAGMIIGPYTPPHTLVTDIPNIKIIAELGVIFLMFSLGLEFSFHKLTRVGFSAAFTGIIEVILMMILGFATGILIDWSYYDSLFLGAALAISSTTIIIKAIEELDLVKKKFAEIVFGILVVEDLLAILILVALSTVVITKSIFSLAMLWATAQLVIVVMGWFLIGYFIVPYSFRKIIYYAGPETLTIVSIALCLILVVFAAHFHYSSALGAFIMGSILAETPQISEIKKLILPIRDIFAAVFFVSVGMLINPEMIIMHWKIVLLISIITIVGKILTSGIGAFMTGQSLNNSLRIGFSMAQVGEFSFIIVALGISMNVVSGELYAIIVAISVITTFATPYLIRFSNYAIKKLDHHLSDKTKRLLKNYSVWIYQTISSMQAQKKYKQATIRFLMNSIIVAIIFKLIEYVLLPYMGSNLLSWITALILSSPFIAAMMLTFKLKSVDKKSFYSSPLLIIAWLLTMTEVSFLTVTYFQTWIVAVFLVVVATLFFAILCGRLEKSYFWFEAQLVSNLGAADNHSEDKFQHLAFWDAHFVNLTISSDSPLVGKTLAEAKLRNKYGVNVVGIQRGTLKIFMPRGKQELMPNDRLVVFGTDAQIDQIRELIEKTVAFGTRDILESVNIKSISVREDSPFKNQTIRDSKIREKTEGVVMGLMRKGEQILNPDPATTVLEEGDLLLILVKRSI